MKAIQKKRCRCRVANAQADLISEDQRGEDIAAGQRWIDFGQRQGGRYRERIWMNDRLFVNVVHFERMTGSAVDQHCVRQRRSVTASPE